MARDDHHARGQKDVAGGKYNPPHNSSRHKVHNFIAGQPKSEREDRDAYYAGRAHAEKQKKQKK